jgi:enamine deaminase RidA (YjgF/YER057c/UK114 family)
MSDSTARKIPASGSGNTILNPAGWPQPKGYANGIKARGDMVFVGGMIGWDTEFKLPQGFVAQTKQLLENIVAVLKEGGAGPEHVVRMTWYVVDIDEYRDCLAIACPISARSIAR